MPLTNLPAFSSFLTFQKSSTSPATANTIQEFELDLNADAISQAPHYYADCDASAHSSDNPPVGPLGPARPKSRHSNSTESQLLKLH